MTDKPMPGFANMWDAIEETPETAANMQLRSELMMAVQTAVVSRNLPQAQAATRLGVTQPRLNDLLRGRIAKFSLDALVGLAEHSGLALRL